jgi:glycosyltransferase involved in cell wall biosynthesis
VQKEIDVILATLEGPLSGPAMACIKDGVDLRTYSHHWQFSLKIIGAINEISKNIDIIHGHGLWLPANWATGFYAKRYNKPFVITTRGALNPNALSHSVWKKRLAGLLFDNRNLHYADCIHVTSSDEYESIRSYGLKNPVAVIPNGIDFETFNNLHKRSSHIGNFKGLEGKKVLLYLSRISWEKGLVELAESWDRIAPEFEDWVLLIVGDGKPEYVSKLKARFDAGKGRDRIVWTGILTGSEKLEAYAVADLFVLPSHTENFSLVTAEALAAGVPVVTTRGTPWSDLKEKNCGWWVPIGTEHLTGALRQAMNLPDVERQKMGENGKRLIEGKYTWGRIAAEMVSVYDWILNGRDIPDCVRMR